MSTPQDAPTRKNQKIRATRKLALWRKKKAAEGASADTAATPAKKTAKKTAQKAAPAKTAAAKK